MRKALFQMRQLMEMRRHERLAADPIVKEFNDGLRDRHPFACRGAAAQLINDDKAATRRLLRHDLNVHHLDHERTLPADEIIGSADPREDPVGDRDARGARRHEAADLRHEADHCHLPHIRTLTGHVRTGNEQDAALLLQQARPVRDERAVLDDSLHHRVSTVFNGEIEAFADLRLAEVMRRADRRQRLVHIGGGNHLRQLLQSGDVLRNPVAKLREQFILQIDHFILRFQNERFFLFEFWRYVSLCIRKRLFTLVAPFLQVRTCWPSLPR